jgi:ATP-dependent Lon protease
MLPARNRKDLEEISPEVRKRIELVWIDHADQAIATALAGEPAPIAPGRSDGTKAA